MSVKFNKCLKFKSNFGNVSILCGAGYSELPGSSPQQPMSTVQNRGIFKSSSNKSILNVPLFKTLVKVQPLPQYTIFQILAHCEACTSK